eukprot:TRINITY_DN743_c0_g2_i2.p1 TRINITY_DN743_c0_g2~~TRINITY_DN743_c0_g2_i2.p1  ORF type:complete len:556 (+),score=111.23 TRINITY_DN743_c0_g2_i2:90-1757(+)
MKPTTATPAMAIGAALLLLLLVIVAEMVPPVEAGYDDGKLAVGDVYGPAGRDRQYEVPSAGYTVYQLPYGITYYQARQQQTTTGGGGNQSVVSTVISHIPCPSGQRCDYDSKFQGVLTLTIPDLKVVAKTPLLEAQFGTFEESLFLPGNAIPLPGNTTSSNTSNATLPLAFALYTRKAVLSAVPLPDGTGAVSRQLAASLWQGWVQGSPGKGGSGLVHVYQRGGSIGQLGTLYVYDSALGSVATVDAPLRDYEVTASCVRPPTSDDPNHDVFFGVRPTQQQGMFGLLRYSALQPGTTMQFHPLQDTSGLPVVGLMPDPRPDQADVGVIYLFRQNTSAVDNNDLSKTSDLYVLTYSTSQGTFTHLTYNIAFGVHGYAGSFVFGDRLWVYTVGGELLRFPLRNTTGEPERMSFTIFETDNCLAASRGTQPYLYSATVSETDGTATFFANWWGYVIRVDLNRFCPDTTCRKCESKHSKFPGGPGGIAGVVIGSIAAVAISAALTFKYRRQLWASVQRVRGFESLDDKAASCKLSAKEWKPTGGKQDEFGKTAVGEQQL